MSLLFLQPAGPKAGTPGVVQDSSSPSPAPAQGQAPAGYTMLLPFLIMVPFLFLMFRRQKKEQEQRSKLKKGDRVVSQSGLVGELLEMDDRLAKVKIAPGTTVQMLASSLAPLDPAPKAADKKADTKDLSDLKEAKAAADKK